MNQILVVGHAGEEVLYVAVPVALIMWLRNLAKRRGESEGEPPDGRPSPEGSREKAG